MRSWLGQGNASRRATPVRVARIAILLGLASVLVAAPLLGEGRTVRSKATVIPIDGDIDDIMLGSIERRIDDAKAAGATQLIFEMDTHGGAVVSALEICRLIMRQQDDGIHTVAWINDKAYSAGALISVSCDEIWMGSASSIGDCAPIMLGATELGETERAKAESPILQMFRECATRNGYDQLLCRAMVQVGTEVWWIEQVNPPEGQEPERRFVSGEEKTQLIDDVTDESAREWKLVEQDALPQPIDGKDTLLTMSASDAVSLGFARGTAAKLSDLADQLGLTVMPSVSTITGWERFVMWLSSPVVRGVFFLIMIVGGYIEFQHPGLILPGSVALVAAVIFFGAPYAAGLADIWTILLFILGLILLGVEIFVIPGFGICGILGIVFLVIALIGSFVPAEPLPDDGSWLPRLPTLQDTWDRIKVAIIVLSSSVIASVVGLILLAKYLPSLPGARALSLGNPEQVTLPPRIPAAETALVGDIGVVVGDLKPAGRARFGNEVVDVVTQGQYVDAGVKVQVIRREGMNIFVRPLPEEA
ncbi:MAG: hypothetical protein JXO22_18185 [Phycisphaerae bacterium]|nr:hypothetical protein [Phycisphaerae bacterium]